MTAMLDNDSFAAHAWDSSVLGPREGWSRQLRFMCDFLLRSKQPMFVLWGPHRAFICNPAYQDIWGISAIEALGRPIAEVAGANWELLKPLVDQVFSGRITSIQTDFSIAASPGEAPRYFDFSYTPLLEYEAEEREVVGALCISTDVTARHLAAEETRESRQALALTVDNVAEGVALVDSQLNLIVVE